jgi:succinate dehydrogenase / fumarate reductase flavoprotein subunit
MQGLADGYFIIPCTVPDYIASTKLDPVDTFHPTFKAAKAEVKIGSISCSRFMENAAPDSFHKELGKTVWDDCGMARSDAGLRTALARIPELRDEF